MSVVEKFSRSHVLPDQHRSSQFILTSLVTEKSEKQGRRTYSIVIIFPSLLQDADCRQYGRPMQAVQGAVLAVVLTTGMGLALPQEYLPAARADNSFVSAAERRRQEALQRRELLTKA